MGSAAELEVGEETDEIKYIGLIVGLIVGVVWMWLGLKELAFVLVCRVVGLRDRLPLILEGQLDVQRFIDDLRRQLIQ